MKINLSGFSGGRMIGLIAGLLFATNPCLLLADKYEEARKALTEKYGVEPKRWQGWVDQPSEKPVGVPFETAGKKLGIAPTYLYTLAAGEGLIVWLDKNPSLNGKIDGFQTLGTDQFCHDAARLIEAGLLRKDFVENKAYTCAEVKNEQGKIVRYGIFPTYVSAIEAFSALIAHRRKLFLDDAHKFDMKNPSEDQIAFWTYAYYVDGEGDAAKHLRETGLDFTKSKRTQVKDLCLIRLSTWRYVQKFTVIKD